MFKWLFKKKTHCEMSFSSIRHKRVIWALDGIQKTTAAGNLAAYREIVLLRKVAEDIYQVALECCDDAKNAQLGPMLYDISAEDLFRLSGRHRRFVAMSKARYLNDICATDIYAYNQATDPCQHDIEVILEWKRDCVMRITEAQVIEAADAQAVQRGGN